MIRCENVPLIELLEADDDVDTHSPGLTRHLESCTHCQGRLAQLAANAGQWNEVLCLLSTGGIKDALYAESLNASEHWKNPIVSDDAMAKSLLSTPRHPELLGRIGRYDVERLIGRGGMGVVFKAHDSELNRPVAVKLLAPHLASIGAARNRFAREARAAAAVVDDHVVPIYNVEVDAKQSFLVMKYIHGGSLQQRLDRDGPLDACEVLRIGMQTARGLAAAHAQGLIHRDVKPSNILLDEGVDRALLTDFGLARASDDSSLTQSGFLPGTPHYMSPEQVRGDAIDARSDLFSLGTTMYTLCTGHSPFRGESVFSVLHRLTHDEPRPIQESNPHVPAWLCSIITKLMSKRPDGRFESAQEVADLLEKCLAHVQQPMAVTLPAELHRTHSFFQTSRSRLFLGVTLMLSISLLASLLILQVPEVPRAGSTVLPSSNTGTGTLDSKQPADEKDATKPIPPGARAFGGHVFRYMSASSTRTVVQPNGDLALEAREVQNLDGARIHLCKVTHARKFAEADRVEVIQTISTNADGRFAGIVPPEFTGLFEREPSDPFLALVVEAEGCITDSRSSLPEHWNNDMNFGLEPNEKIVRGQILVDGNPAGSVSVTAIGVERAYPDELDAFLKQESSNPIDVKEPRKEAFYGGPDPEPSGLKKTNMFLSVEQSVTDNQGEFELRGFGPNDVLTLEIEGPGVERTWLRVINRNIDDINLRHRSGYVETYYGCGFTYHTQVEAR